MSEKLKTLHISITITLNESTYNWDDPQVNTRISFPIPLVMFEPKRLVDIISQHVKDVEAAFPDAVIEYTRQKAEEERVAKEKELEVSLVASN